MSMFPILDRIESVIEDVENDRPVNWDKVCLLVRLDARRYAVQKAAETVERTRRADDLAFEIACESIGTTVPDIDGTARTSDGSDVE